ACHAHGFSWLPSLPPRRRRLTLPSEPYDDGRNAVKAKTRSRVPAEGRGVHLAACPVGMGHGHRQGALRGQRSSRRETASFERHASPPSRACMRLRYPLLVGGNRRGNVRASPAPYVRRAWLAATRNVIRRARPP